jgi:hypothetical protein
MGGNRKECQKSHKVKGVRLREALENPSPPVKNTHITAGTDWVHGHQAARIR